MYADDVVVLVVQKNLNDLYLNLMMIRKYFFMVHIIIFQLILINLTM